MTRSIHLVIHVAACALLLGCSLHSRLWGQEKKGMDSACEFRLSWWPDELLDTRVAVLYNYHGFSARFSHRRSLPKFGRELPVIRTKFAETQDEAWCGVGSGDRVALCEGDDDPWHDSSSDEGYLLNFYLSGYSVRTGERHEWLRWKDPHQAGLAKGLPLLGEREPPRARSFEYTIHQYGVVRWCSRTDSVIFLVRENVLWSKTYNGESLLIEVPLDEGKPRTLFYQKGEHFRDFWPSPSGRYVVTAPPFLEAETELKLFDRETGQYARLEGIPPHVGKDVSWSPDERQIAYVGAIKKKPRLVVLDIAAPHAYVDLDDAHWTASWSPDGSWIAYDSTTVDMINFITPDGKTRLRGALRNPGGGMMWYPSWSADSRFFACTIACPWWLKFLVDVRERVVQFDCSIDEHGYGQYVVTDPETVSALEKRFADRLEPEK